MVHLQIGSLYEFTLASGRQVLIIVHGSQQQPSGQIGWEISVNGVKAIHKGINEALGENFAAIKLIP